MDVLLPLDGKPHSQLAIDLATTLLAIKDRSLMLVHVVDDPPTADLLADRTGTYEADYKDASISASGGLLAAVAKPLEKAGARVAVSVESGLPLPTIKGLVVKEKPRCLIAVPGRHSPAQLLAKGSLSESMLQFDLDFTLMLARAESAVRHGPVTQVLSGSAEDALALERLAYLVRHDLPFTLVASPLGLCGPTNSSQFGRRSETQADAEGRFDLDDAARLLKKLGRQYTQVLLDTTVEEWLESYIETAAPALVSFTRTRKDVLHRAIDWSPAERLFLKASCATALSCSKIAM